jgi:hypothetical protein
MPGRAISHRFAPNAWVSHRTCARAGRPRQAEVMDLQAAGVEFIDENGGGPGVRSQKPTQ